MGKLLAATGLMIVLSACGNGNTGTLMGGPNGDSPGSANGGSDPGSPGSGGTPNGQQGNGSDPNANSNPNIDQRQINYGEALRTAALKLVGDLPTLADINSVTDATSYGAMIDKYLADPRFVTRQIQWWRDTLKTGQTGMKTGNGAPSYDTAATFAAEVVVNDRPFTDILTASTNTCPTFASGTFTDASCNNNAPTAGVLTDPGIMAQYYANMAFRRVRFIQETFVCSKFPAEFSATPQIMGSGAYTSPWPFNSITGGSTAKINFQDTSAVICANCHTTENHMAPMFGYFDMNGQYTAGKFQVQVPSQGNPTATLADWLPASEGFAWRNGKPVKDIPSFAAAMAADPDVQRCIVTREWNYAMSRGDVVDDVAGVPSVVTDPLLQDFTANGMKVKRLLRNILTSDDFVKF
ncbi:MAG TPA: DUF1549 domain-containing protein [Polyangiaceae bacterium]|jgi:hypothetical protein